jgi:hypothetical protein
MASRIKIDYNDKALKRNVSTFKTRLRKAVALTTERHAAETTAWMKTNARWTDRTSAARTGLYTVATHSPSYEELLMGYSVNYGIWLEVANDRQYSIILPAMRIMGESLMQNLEYVIDRMPKS